MSAVSTTPAAGLPAAPVQSPGVWRAAWRRLRNDRVGMVSLVIVLAFLLLVLAAATGLAAANWQKEVGVPNAPPTFMGPRAQVQGTDALAT
ncbi:MAG: ABC transporter permease, partial [Burkholderiaceae bacterium]